MSTHKSLKQHSNILSLGGSSTIVVRCPRIFCCRRDLDASFCPHNIKRSKGRSHTTHLNQQTEVNDLAFHFLLPPCRLRFGSGSVFRHTHSCSSVYAPKTCNEIGSLNGCTSDSICDLFCEDQAGCSCSLSNFNCEATGCDGTLSCTGFPDPCESFESSFDCEGQSGCFWIPDNFAEAVDDEAADDPGICQGSAAPCSSVCDHSSCITTADVDTCDTSQNICAFSCENQEGCRCTVSNFLCETVGFSVFCDGTVVCEDQARSCSRMDTRSECDNQQGCQWIPVEIAAALVPTPVRRNSATKSFTMLLLVAVVLDCGGGCCGGSRATVFAGATVLVVVACFVAVQLQWNH